ncbi:hypothetical protein BKA70DRAFT_1397995 [Coprinopsis sp. MPI-PUGE-AT-0042]|nr:hypothetical protein BKA70DRAFT_1397995 [Coprinopsis sp. MPI-PUGE-AT-0042]
MLTVFQIKSFSSAVYGRIIFSRFTISFFIFSLVYCLTQGILQSTLHGDDFDHGKIVSAIVDKIVPKGNMTFFTGSPGNWHLQMCSDVPHVLITGSNAQRYPCMTVFKSSEDTNGEQFEKTRTLDWEIGHMVVPGVNIDSSPYEPGVDLISSPHDNTTSLNLQCVRGLVLPRQSLNSSRREDIALICLQFWLFAISVIAVVNDSVPHLLTVLVTRTFVTGWSAYAVWRSFRDQAMIQEIFMNPGTPCSLDLFSSYFNRRIPLQISDLVLSATGLVIFAFLTVMLLKAYSAESIRCVGAPDHINRINKYFLALLACLQLEGFILTAGLGMWIDVLLNTAIGEVTRLMRIYIGAFVGTMLILPIWITMGWIAIKREKRWMMNLFLGLSFGILTGWMVMFYSIIYRWTFLQWPFLGCYTVASQTLVVASLVLGVVCRVNFGKGHAEYPTKKKLSSSRRSPPALNFTLGKYLHGMSEPRILTSNPSRANTSNSKNPLTRFSREKDNSSDQPLSVYYIQTLESDGGEGVQGVSVPGKAPFGYV